MDGIVINNEGYKVEYVILKNDIELGKVIPLFYDLKDGESIVEVDVKIALNMLRPKWNGEQWIEEATEEEITESKGDIIEPTKSNLEIQLENYKQSVTEQEGRIHTLESELEEQQEQNLELTLAVLDLYEASLEV